MGGLGRAISRDSSVPGEEGCFSCSTSTSASLGVKELEAIKAKVRAMEKDDEWLQELQNEAKSLLVSSDPGTSRVKQGCSTGVAPGPFLKWGLLLRSEVSRNKTAGGLQLLQLPGPMFKGWQRRALGWKGWQRHPFPNY